MIFNIISHSRTSNAVIDRNERLFLKGGLSTSDKLAAERGLVTQRNFFQIMSRTALKILKAQKRLRSHHGGGTLVADVAGNIFSDEIVEFVPPKLECQWHSSLIERRVLLTGCAVSQLFSNRAQ